MAQKKAKKTGRARPGNLAEDAATRLRDGIRTGRYLAGSPLREAELVQELGMSRVPVREALHRLEGEGLVEIRPNHGASVVAISEHELIEIAEVCRLLEGYLLKRATPLLTPTDFAAAEALLLDLDRQDEPAEWSRTNWRFHTRLYRAAERPLVIGLLSGLRARAEGAMQLLIAAPERRAKLNQEHRGILECIRAQRTDEALALLDAHLLQGKEKVLDLVEERSSARP
jgi:DNA-binding GntR family transcriptional regulator